MPYKLVCSLYIFMPRGATSTSMITSTTCILLAGAKVASSRFLCFGFVVCRWWCGTRVIQCLQEVRPLPIGRGHTILPCICIVHAYLCHGCIVRLGCQWCISCCRLKQPPKHLALISQTQHTQSSLAEAGIDRAVARVVEDVHMTESRLVKQMGWKLIFFSLQAWVSGFLLIRRQLHLLPFFLFQSISLNSMLFNICWNN